MTDPLAHGGCQCGAIRYALHARPMAIFVCHCTECRRQSASAFGISLQVPQSALVLAHGEPRLWSRPTDSGHTLDCWFCSRCGTRLWHQRRGATATLNIKGGSLDEAVDLTEAIHIWTRSRLPGVVIPEGARQYPQEPD